MSAQFTHPPPPSHIFRPEKGDRNPGFLDSLYRNISISASSRFKLRGNWINQFTKKVDDLSRPLEGLSINDLGKKAEEVKRLFLKNGRTMENNARSFAIIRELSDKILGLRHFNTQLAGARILLEGMIAEMETGEGKTLTATLAAGTVAMAGVPVHVITVNDYLTERDAQWTRPLYEAMGLTTGFVIHGMTPAQRREAYSKDIVYCTNKKLVFDYLKDLLTLEKRRTHLRLHAECLYHGDQRIKKLLLRGLHYAIVDEADSVLIDEARTPLIISGKNEAGPDEQKFFRQAVDLAKRLEVNTHYIIQKSEHKIKLTLSGEKKVKKQCADFGPLWRGKIRRIEVVRLALSAIHLFKKDEQYMVRQGKVQIIDEFTGRVMPDRSYEKGLHQLIEIKENCEITKQSTVLARISYQRFFRRYLKLSGMTGTAREVKKELLSVYGLFAVTLPTYRQKKRKAIPDTIFSTQQQKWDEVANRIETLNKQGRPVLVGTHSVAASEWTGTLLAQKGLSFRLLNAKQDKEEADIIAQAGMAGNITIATNMAGRGVDIKIEKKVVERDGLHVIITERHDAGRIDRQLAGRCARMGDPGSFEAILSLEDAVFEKNGKNLLRWAALRYPLKKSWVWRFLSKQAILRAQKKIEHMHARMRKNLLEEDARRGNMLSFSGRSE